MNLLMCPELRAVGGESGRKEANRRLSRTAAGTRSLPHTLRTARQGGRGTAASPPLRPGCPRGAVGCPSHAPWAHGAASELANPRTAGCPGLPAAVRGTLLCAPMGARPPSRAQCRRLLPNPARCRAPALGSAGPRGRCQGGRRSPRAANAPPALCPGPPAPPTQPRGRAAPTGPPPPFGGEGAGRAGMLAAPPRSLSPPLLSPRQLPHVSH